MWRDHHSHQNRGERFPTLGEGKGLRAGGTCIDFISTLPLSVNAYCMLVLGCVCKSPIERSMRRGELTDEQWEKLAPLLPPQKPKVGRPARDHRLIVNGILWILRTGAPWRELPERYGSWRTVASRFYRWVNAGVWQRVLQALQQQAEAQGQIDWEKHSVDSTIIRAHQHAAGAKGGIKIKKR